MGRNALYFFLFALMAAPALAAQQGQTPAPKPKPKPKAEAPMQDSDAPPTPSTPEEDIEVAGYYIHKGDMDAAIPRLQEAIQEKPTLEKPRLMLAEIYEKKGNAALAVKTYKDYLQAVPNSPDRKKIEKKIEKLGAR